MWIRSQDKRILVQPTRVVVTNNGSILNYVSNGAYNVAEDYDILGRYETEERALEILDMIVKQLGYCTQYTICEPHLGDKLHNERKADIVFQMLEK